MQVMTRLTLRALFAAAIAAAAALAPMVARGMAEDAMAPARKELNELYWQGRTRRILSLLLVLPGAA